MVVAVIKECTQVCGLVCDFVPSSMLTTLMASCQTMSEAEPCTVSVRHTIFVHMHWQWQRHYLWHSYLQRDLGITVGAGRAEVGIVKCTE